MTLARRRALLALPLLAAPSLARAQASGGAPQPPGPSGASATGSRYPDRAIRFICPFAPGGNADVVSR